MKNIMNLPLTIVSNGDFPMAENQVPGTKNPPTRWSQFKFCLFQPDWYSGFLLPLNPSNQVLYIIYTYIYIQLKKKTVYNIDWYMKYSCNILGPETDPNIPEKTMVHACRRPSSFKSCAWHGCSWALWRFPIQNPPWFIQSLDHIF